MIISLNEVQIVLEKFNPLITCTLINKISKTADSIQVAKSKQATEARDFGSVIAKCLEKLIAPHIASSITAIMQFADKCGRSRVDALSLRLDNITEHIDKSAKNYVRAISIHVDSSCAFKNRLY